VSEVSPAKILVVDDDPNVLLALKKLLGRSGDFTCVATEDPLEALSLLEQEAPEVVLTDLQMPHLSGLQLLQHVRQKDPSCEVVLMTGFGSIKTAVEAVKAGAYDFLTKPFEDGDLVDLTVHKAVEHRRLRTRNERLEAELATRDGFDEFIGDAPEMQRVYKLIETLARSDTTILIQGESGTGKELVARALHFRSPRKDRPFIAVNCSALPAGLVESELFGHARGAFSGAVAAKKGLFEAADGGTLFLDEIADLPPNAQVQLLRVLQEGEVRRVGANEIAKVDVRVVAASNIDLAKAKDEGRFRTDLFYRLNVVPIHLPPLRERPDDIGALAQHFLIKHATRNGSAPPRLSAEALAVLRRYRWPGNVRELENAMERALVFADGDHIGPAVLPPQVLETAGGELAIEDSVHPNLRYADAKRQALRVFEQRYLGALMQRSKGNVSAAARAAGMDRPNLRRLLKAQGIDPQVSPEEPTTNAAEPAATPDAEGTDMQAKPTR
jgi:DNA-binding NtrC family response regulator